MAARSGSSALAAPAFPRRLERGVPPVVVFAGAEAWFREDGLRRVVGALLPGGDVGASLLRADARRPEQREMVSAAVDELRSPSLFGDGKVVVIDNAEAATGPWAPEGGKRTSPMVHLARAALEHPREGSALVLMTKKGAKGAGAAPVKTLEKLGALVVDCRALYDAPGPWQRGAPPYDHELARFLSARMMTEHDRRMGAPAAHAVSRLVGSDLGRLDDALRTLALYVGDRPEVGIDDVDASLGATRSEPAWNFTDAVLDGDATAAGAFLDAAFERGITDVRGANLHRPEALCAVLTAALHQAYRRVRLGAEAIAAGDGDAEVTKAAGIPSFRSQAFLSRCRRDPEAWARCHSAFLDAELGVKGGGVPPRLALERLTVTLLSAARPPSVPVRP